MIDDRMDAVVLARIATTRGPTDAAIERSVRRLRPASIEPARWSAMLVDSRRRLEAAHAIDSDRHVTARTTPWARFGSRTAIPWLRLVDRVIPGLALDIDANDTRCHAKLTDRDAWASAIVGRDLGVWTDGTPPSLPRVCDALVWRSLGLAGLPKRTPPEIRALFVGREIDGMPGPPERQVRQLAARAVRAPRADLRALREALAHRWLLGVSWSTGSAPDGDLEPLARAVRDAARDARDENDGLFGDRKVFISSVWDAIRDRPALRGLDVVGFKTRLVEAHRRGLVSLARADLVGAMDPARVAASEIADMDARYHFVVREARR